MVAEDNFPSSFNIRLRNLELQNFRLFSLLNFEFDEELRVLIGENGSGKSTVMDVSAALLKILLSEVFLSGFEKELYEQEKQVNFTRSDVKNGTLASLCSLSIELTYPEYIGGEQENLPEMTNMGYPSKDDEYDLSDPESWKEKKELVKFGFSINRESGIIRLVSYENILPFKNAFEGFYREGDSLPVMIYYGCNELEIDSPALEYKKSYISAFQQIYQGALTPERYSFNQFYNWFDRETKVSIDWDSWNEEERIVSLNRNNKLTFVKDAILKVLNYKDEKPIYENLRMDYNQHGDALVVTRLYKDDAIKMEVDQMSSGEKSLIALVADIAKRVIEANPNSDNPLEDGKGIVLIDEIDLHLHPKWQNDIVEKLTKTFRQIQFVVTTHSPLIISHIPPKKIALLARKRIYNVYETFGRDANYILSTVMGVEKAGIFTVRFMEIARLLTDNRLDEADIELNAIKKEIEDAGDEGESHPDIIRYRFLIDRKRRMLTRK